VQQAGLAAARLPRQQQHGGSLAPEVLLQQGQLVAAADERRRGRAGGDREAGGGGAQPPGGLDQGGSLRRRKSQGLGQEFDGVLAGRVATPALEVADGAYAQACLLGQLLLAEAGILAVTPQQRGEGGEGPISMRPALRRSRSTALTAADPAALPVMIPSC
jgi:hypothetical protein